MNIKPYRSSREADRKRLKELKESERERKREKERKRSHRNDDHHLLNLFSNRDGLSINKLKKSGRKVGMGFFGGGEDKVI